MGYGDISYATVEPAIPEVVNQRTRTLVTALGGDGSATTFSIAPGRPRLLRAKNFGDAADSDETKINAAITQALSLIAITGNAYGVVVDEDMLPYGVDLTTADSSHVLHRSTVHMFRETGQWNDAEYDVRAYGAAGNGSADDYAPLQSVFTSVESLNAALSNPTKGPTKIVFPPGHYRSSLPLLCGADGLWIQGSVGMWPSMDTDYKGPCMLTATFFAGPLLLVVKSTQTFTNLTTALVGSGSAANWTSDSWHLNLRDANTLDINGLSAFTAECFYASSTSSVCSIVGGLGAFVGEPAARAFLLAANSGAAYFRLNLSGGIVTITGGTVSDGVAHHLAGTYDGTTVRLFIDGNLVASSAGSGTVVQNWCEGVWVGRGFADMSEGNQDASWFGPRGTVDAIHISNVARYTAAFAKPSAKPTKDTHTLGLLNFDSQRGPMTRMQTKSGDAWIVQRQVSPTATTYGFRLEGITLKSNTAGGATMVHLRDGVVMWSIERCAFEAYRVGIVTGRGNKFQWSMRQLMFHNGANTHAGLLLGPNAGIGNMEHVWWWGNPIPLLACTVGWTLKNGMFQLESDSRAGPQFYSTQPTSAPVKFDLVTINGESGTASDFRACLLVGGGQYLNGLVATSSTFMSSTDKPVVVASGSQCLSFRGCQFWTTGSPVAIFQVSSLVKPIGLDDCWRATTTIPWCDTPGAVRIGRMGKLGAFPYDTTPVFDCSLRDEFEITLTGDCAPTITHVTPGQSILVTIIQDGSGSHGFTWPANVKGGGTISATGGSVNQQRFTAMLDSATNPTLMADAAMVSV